MAAQVQAEAERALIAREFQSHYYSMLRDKAHQAQFFYYDESVVSRCSPRDLSTMPLAVGQAAINAKILSSGLAGSETSVLSLDHQEAPGGILVVAAGNVRLASEPAPRRFVQTFLLVKRSGSFFIRNDVHRLLDVPPIAAAAVPGAAVPSPHAMPPAQRGGPNGIAQAQDPAVLQAVAASPQGPMPVAGAVPSRSPTVLPAMAAQPPPASIPASVPVPVHSVHPAAVPPPLPHGRRRAPHQ